MDDLISRQAAIDDAKSWVGVNWYEQHLQRNVIEWLKEFPTAQPEIVRCKDCAKREICRTSTVWAVAPGDDWFCADAERRTDE